MSKESLPIGLNFVFPLKEIVYHRTIKCEVTKVI